MEPKWLEWAKKLQALAQNGLTFSQNEFDIDRYQQITKIASEIMAGEPGDRADELLEFFKYQEGYSTPKVDVRGAAFRNGKILMVKEKIDGKWTIPGGWADPNETPSSSVEREVFEESGFRVKAMKLAAVYDRTKQGHTPYYPFHVYKIFFICQILGGSPLTSNETDAVDFFGEDEFPPLSAARINENQLHSLFRHLKKMDLPAEFD